MFLILCLIITIAVGILIEYLSIHQLRVDCKFHGLAVTAKLLLCYLKTKKIVYLLVFIGDMIDIIAFCIITYLLLT